MKLNDLYRDIYSNLNLDGTENAVYFLDIVNAINDTIRRQRQDYILNGIGLEFTVTEAVTPVNEDAQYSFLNSITLANNVVDSVRIDKSVPSTIGYKVTDTILDQVQTFSKGTLATKGNIIYKSVESFAGVNTFNLTFDGSNIRSFYRGNGLKYFEGDVIKDSETGSFFRVTSDFAADASVAAINISELTKVYWVSQGKSFTNVSKYPFYAIDALSVFEDYEQSEAITINKNKLYATKGLKKIVLTYFPEWTDITNLDTDIDLPDFMIASLKEEVINKMRTKLYKRYSPINRYQEGQDESDNSGS